MQTAASHFPAAQGWQTHPGCAARGQAFCGPQLLSTPALLAHAGAASTAAELTARLLELNGFFALALTLPDGTLCLAADRVRSIPLFYSRQPEHWLVSADPHWLHARAGGAPPAPAVRTEFRVLTYVLGADTLDPAVQEVPAGELALLHADGRVTRQRWFELEYHYAEPPAGEAELRAGCLASATQSIARLQQVAAGRRIVIPLSGGLDSRLIALLLHRAGYRNILCFSYGKPGIRDVAYARASAERLGLDWECVPYSAERWQAWGRLPGFQTFLREGGMLAAAAHIQDWPAVYELLRTGRLRPDDLLVPGHSPLTGEGTRTEPRMTDGEPCDLDFCVDYFLRLFYGGTPLLESEQPLLPELRARIRQEIGGGATLADNNGPLERFMHRGLKAKFLFNSLRVYESFGLAWWLPFADNAVIDYWLSVPPGWKRRRDFYRSCVRQLYRDTTGQRLREAGLAPVHLASRVLRRVAGQQPYVRRLYRVLKRTLDYDRHGYGWYGLFGRQEFLRRFSGTENIYHLLAADALRELEAERTRSDPA